MSGSSRHRQGWLGQNYEKLILVVVLLGLLASALFLVLQVYKERNALKVAQWNQPTSQPKKAAALSADGLQAKGAALVQPFQMDLGAKGLMASELRVSCVNIKCAKPIPDAAVICPFCGTKQPMFVPPDERSTAGDGIPDKWKNKYGLDIHDPRIANEDPDNDGFTNMEEFRAATDPKDPKSHPDIAIKLRILGEVKVTPFKLRFMGIMKMPAGLVFQLNLRSGRTHLKKIGEDVEGFKLQAFEPHDQAPEQQDVIILLDGRETIRLVKGIAKVKSEITATLIFLLDHSTYHVTSDKAFSLRDREKSITNYKVIDIKTDGVKIVELTSGRETIVPPATPAEALLDGAEMKPKETAPPGTNASPRDVRNTVNLSGADNRIEQSNSRSR